MRLAVIEAFAIIVALVNASPVVQSDMLEETKGLASALIDDATPGKGPLESPFPAMDPNYDDQDLDNPTQVGSHLSKRQLPDCSKRAFPNNHVNCNVPWPTVRGRHISRGLIHLAKSDRCHRVGPKQCDLAWCGDNSAISVCNDVSKSPSPRTVFVVLER